MKKAKKAKEEKCLCPYCEIELIEAQFPFCQACGATVHYCLKCHITVLDKGAKSCPKCGESLS